MNSSAREITLPKTKLSVSERHLIRRSDANQVVGDIALESITRVSVRMETDWSAVFIPIGLFVIAVACKYFIGSSAVGWGVSIPIGVLGVLSVLGLNRPLLAIETRDGQVTIVVKDALDEAETFALALIQRLEKVD